MKTITISKKEFDICKQETIARILKNGSDPRLHLPYQLVYAEPTTREYPVYNNRSIQVGKTNITFPKGHIFASHNELKTAQKHLEKVAISGIKALIIR
jgi:hypothetical protein